MKAILPIFSPLMGYNPAFPQLRLSFNGYPYTRMLNLNGKMMKKLIILALIFIPAFAFAQTKFVVKGKIRDNRTCQSLKDAHIYINESLGTISDKDGYFSLILPQSFSNEILHISYMGYENYEIPVRDFRNHNLLIGLSEDPVLLHNVVVEADPWIQFRDVIGKISLDYKDKGELYAAIVNEIQEMKIEGYQENSAKNFAKVSTGFTISMILLAIIAIIQPFLIIWKKKFRNNYEDTL